METWKERVESRGQGLVKVGSLWKERSHDLSQLPQKTGHLLVPEGRAQPPLRFFLGARCEQPGSALGEPMKRLLRPASSCRGLPGMGWRRQLMQGAVCHCPSWTAVQRLKAAQRQGVEWVSSPSECGQTLLLEVGSRTLGGGMLELLSLWSSWCPRRKGWCSLVQSPGGVPQLAPALHQVRWLSLRNPQWWWWSGRSAALVPLLLAPPAPTAGSPWRWRSEVHGLPLPATRPGGASTAGHRAAASASRP